VIQEYKSGECLRWQIIAVSHPSDSEGRHGLELISLPILNMQPTSSLLSRVMVVALIFASQLVIAVPAPNGRNTVRYSGELECKSHAKMLTTGLTTGILSSRQWSRTL